MGSVNYSTYDLSDKIIEFCDRNSITKEEIDRIYQSDSIKNEKLSRINPLVHQYGIQDASGPEIKDICIKDVVGFEPYNDKRNLCEILSTCYSDGTATYGLRANDKLQLSKDEMINDIKDSVSFESINLDEVDGKLLVSTNGCHRAAMLKFLYLDEVLKGEKLPEEINEKYTIKGKVFKYDMTMTYMNYFLQMMKAVSYIKLDYDDKGLTGKYVIVNDTKTTVSRDEILDLFNKTLEKYPDKVDLDKVNMYACIPSFRDFLKEHVLKENEYGNSRNNM